MDHSRPELSERFESHWSIRKARQIRCLVFKGRSVWTNGSESSSRVLVQGWLFPTSDIAKEHFISAWLGDKNLIEHASESSETGHSTELYFHKSHQRSFTASFNIKMSIFIPLHSMILAALSPERCAKGEPYAFERGFNPLRKYLS